jgi:type II secretory pathway pseudopilin PulG
MRQKSKKTRGFALIATILLMVLLAIITVGTLSLSVVTLRTGTQDSAQAKAQANARMALMIAIGELQKQVGPDQRITANGGILDNAATPANEALHPHWTGVWDSWKANGPPAGNDEPSQQSTIDDAVAGIHPTYETNREDHFRSWLVSLDSADAALVDAARNMTLNGSYMPTKAQDAIILVGKGSLGGSPAAEDLIQAALVPIKPDSGATAPSGRYGWWVGDESQKANIMDDSYKAKKATSLAERLVRQHAPASMGNSEIKGLENVADQSSFSLIPTRKTLRLINGATDEVTEQFHDITTRSLGVLADVREGGLKRDLSTILERTIDPDEVYNFTNVADFRRASSLKPYGDDFMLYRFDNMVTSSQGTTGEAAVPIQDLAAYYQLYDGFGSGREGGIQFTSRDSSPSNNNLRNGIMVSNPDYGGTNSDYQKYLRQYTALYRSPVIVKVEMMFSYVSELRPQADIDADTALGITDPDRYILRIGFSPAMTFWNPNNVPLVMNIGNPELASIMMRETPIPLRVTFKKSTSYAGAPTKQTVIDFNKITNTQQGELYTLFVSGRYPSVFEPGESKVFALRFASNTSANSASNYTDFALRGRVGNRYGEPFIPELELVPGWNPEKFVRPDNQQGGGGRTNDILLTFKEGDYISASVQSGGYNSFAVDYTQKSRHGRNAPGVMWHYRSFGIRSRQSAGAAFKNDFVYRGFPGGAGISDPAPRTIDIAARKAETLISAMRSRTNPRDDLPQAFFYYSIKAATETHESENIAPISGGAGRRFPSRPFTHSTAMSPPFLDSTDPAALYNYGWNWFFMPLDNSFDAPISISRDNAGYYGGGYTAENGATHIVQQYLPVTPPISIASLSQAHLGGFSLATEAPAAGYNGLRNPVGTEAFRRTTALGFDGFAPHTLQAIGNSYAHPNLAPDQALGTWDRYYSEASGRPVRTVELFADHSYLANKALWDEFFFSSISPKPSSSRAYSGSASAQQVADDFFSDEKPLPNPRMVPYKQNFTDSQLSALVGTYDQYKDGFADKIAAHMMVEGPFNINSTSVTAWKALFSSLKGHDVSYLDANSALVLGMNLDFDKTDGVPVSGGPLPNGKGYKGSSKDPSDREQWTGFRELTATEIDELAEAMVRQVKLRGPFLSLSDFINRRLEDGTAAKKELALRGALQAAIDDPAVSINEGFRDSKRKFSGRERSYVNAAFPEAMEGPVAYGSSAYVDQADILRGIPAQLTPRGDTFVIRAYGDSLDADGNVRARAWCEAILQRFPDYIDPVDEAHTKQADLTSQGNQDFGRKFNIVQFRWLNSSEI